MLWGQSSSPAVLLPSILPSWVRSAPGLSLPKAGALEQGNTPGAEGRTGLLLPALRHPQQPAKCDFYWGKQSQSAQTCCKTGQIHPTDYPIPPCLFLTQPLAPLPSRTNSFLSASLFHSLPSPNTQTLREHLPQCWRFCSDPPQPARGKCQINPGRRLAPAASDSGRSGDDGGRRTSCGQSMTRPKRKFLQAELWEDKNLQEGGVSRVSLKSRCDQAMEPSTGWNWTGRTKQGRNFCETRAKISVCTPLMI